ncbi:MAG: phosphatidylinositol-specific phospholipase C1-like protein [Bacteroidota bacterium]|nr:phosphatidylinositol-specific phospholipase C1-like protein [Bacteroidota bacterium]MDP4213632.1 phosphatidylinositol-specific phospholipase C1-like protein [Bacteroidota bacterium]MDP4252049.1 phosphatidylinositol-specific phospholipase C1-like protein [Bacteroidota bacterium]
MKFRVFMPFLLILLLPACRTGVNMDDLPLNHIQVIGSHNSYKRAIDPLLFREIVKADSARARGLAYSHIDLSKQLDLGLRNLEIDICADSLGGRYAHPRGLDWVKGQQPFDTAHQMEQPGFKVLHVPDIDFRSNCVTLRNCLHELKGWSDAHRDQGPVFITMNAKDDGLDKPGSTVPEQFNERVFDKLDSTLLKDLGREKLIIPDDIRGSAETLETAVLNGHWPTVKASRGKFIFILDETGDKRTSYSKGHPSLKGRVLFTNADPGTPEAAILIRNDPQKDSIRALVKKGYIVRTRADSDTEEARVNDKTRFRAACNSGAQIITTDYYQKSSFFNSDYKISFPGGKYIRADSVLLN